ncbi:MULTISPECIES: site-specific integrase [Paraburkholderia]|uniref:Site-specific integrase n=1 Tax=Paraburkholderia metrosideri TaxID=580937 RepID=A0ABW9E3Q4_9BURK
MEPKRAKVLTPAKFRHLLRVTEATSRFPERDALILLLGVTCGMRVTEIARIEIRDVLTKSGARREEVSLRGSITKGCRPRCVYLAHERTIAAFDCYIEWRYRRGAGAALDRREYRGLMPHTRLILTQKGSAFELSVKRRVNFVGETVEYLAADSLQSYVTGLYRAAGLGAGHSSHSGRRTFARATRSTPCSCCSAIRIWTMSRLILKCPHASDVKLWPLSMTNSIDGPSERGSLCTEVCVRAADIAGQGD